MSIIISNITTGERLYDDTTAHDYLVQINAKNIVTFNHRRDEGLAVCLRRAADAIDAQGRPIECPSFKRG